jgi:hypothetical protein
MTFKRFGEDLGDTTPRIGYVTHRHLCNAWCRLSLNAGLTYSRRSDDISDVIRADYEAMGYRVLDVRWATEVPSDDPRLVIRPFAWLVMFEEYGRPTRLGYMSVSTPSSAHFQLITVERRCGGR